MMFCSLTVCFHYVFCFSWSKRMEAPSPHLDKSSPNVNWPETWRRLMTGVWLNTVQTVIIVLFHHFLSPCIMYTVHTVDRVCFCSLCTTGVVRLHINNWLEVSFCLPHKIHRIGGNHIPPEALEHSLKAIRFVWNYSVKCVLFLFFFSLLISFT